MDPPRSGPRRGRSGRPSSSDSSRPEAEVATELQSSGRTSSRKRRSTTNEGEPSSTRRRREVETTQTSSGMGEDVPVPPTESLQSIPEQEEINLEHLNVTSRERRELIARLGVALARDTVPAPFWGLLQTADVERLRWMLDSAEKEPWFVNYFVDHGGSKENLKAWKQRLPQSRGPSETPAGTPQTSPQTTPSKRAGRETEPKRLARERDNDRCVFTHKRPIHVPHIFPHCLIHPSALTASKVPAFWNFLSAFWKPEQLARWRSQIFSDCNNPAAADACFNHICMQPTFHSAWSDAKFALRPLQYNADKTELDVEFHWQPTPRHTIDDNVPINMLPESSEGLQSSTYHDGIECDLAYVSGSGSGAVTVVSGQVFKFATAEPQRLPLPSKELLDLQWHLQRALAMSGGGEAEDSDYEGDEGDVGGDYPADTVDRRAHSSSDSSQAYFSENEDVDRFDLSLTTLADDSPLKSRLEAVQQTAEAPADNIDEATEVATEG